MTKSLDTSRLLSQSSFIFLKNISGLILNLFLFGAGRVTGLGRLFRRRRGSGGGLFLALYRGGLGPLALGHFVSRLGRGLVRGRLISLGRAATAGPRPSRFAGPRFFFLGLTAPPALGLILRGRGNVIALIKFFCGCRLRKALILQCS